MSMARRPCGTEGLELPALGIGCWSFGGGDYWGHQEQRDVDSVVSAAIEMGCTYFDTAEVYNDGRSESALGQALKGRRTRVLIGSKVSPNNTSPKTLRAHCDDSLRRLGTGQDHGKFFPFTTEAKITQTNGCLQYSSNFGECHMTGRVAVAPIDILEVIRFDAAQYQTQRVSLCPVNLPLENL